MPPVVYVVLAHEPQIIINTVLPVGIFGEDAAESRNKLNNFVRLYHARKTNRIDTLTNVINNTASNTSDVIISTISLKKRSSRFFIMPENC